MNKRKILDVLYAELHLTKRQAEALSMPPPPRSGNEDNHYYAESVAVRQEIAQNKIEFIGQVINLVLE